MHLKHLTPSKPGRVPITPLPLLSGGCDGETDPLVDISQVTSFDPLGNRIEEPLLFCELGYDILKLVPLFRLASIRLEALIQSPNVEKVMQLKLIL